MNNAPTMVKLDLWLSQEQYAAVVEAARDAQLDTPTWSRIMVMAAAGCGAIAEHLERAIEASATVDKATAELVVGPAFAKRKTR